MNQLPWRDCKLGDLLEIKHGFAFQGEYFGQNGSHIVLTPGNFFDAGGFKKTEGKEKWYSGPIPGDYVLAKGDLIVAMTEQAEGLLGSSAIVPDDDCYLHNQRLGLVLARDGQAEKEFLYYLFNSRSVRQQIRASASGTKVRHTSPSRIAEVKVSVPPPEEQRRIASILSAYDNLIDNVRHRIRVLDEAIRAAYQIALGDPAAPAKSIRFGEIAEESRRNIPKGSLNTPMHYVGLEHIPRRSIALDAWDLTNNIGSNKLKFEKGEILFGKIRPYFHKVSVAPFDGLCSADTIVIRPRRPEQHAVVAAIASSDAFVAHATKTANGAKMPRANWDVLAKFHVAVPAGDAENRFLTFSRNALAEQQALVFQVHNLRSTRDLLLPRLLSGQERLASAPAAA